MKTLSRFAKPVSYAMAAGMLAMSLHLPAARADMIDTEAVVNTAQAQQKRSRLHAARNREEVKTKLLSLGVDPAQVQARVDALTENEAQALAMHIDEMPAAAGADTVTWLLIILLIVLII